MTGPITDGRKASSSESNMKMSSNEASFKINKSQKMKVEMQSTTESVLNKIN